MTDRGQRYLRTRARSFGAVTGTVLILSFLAGTLAPAGAQAAVAVRARPAVTHLHGSASTCSPRCRKCVSWC